MNERFNKKVHVIARKFGFDIIRYEPKSHPLARRKKILDTYNIDLVLDVGANTGQYGLQLREIGYKDRITSFEPLSSAYKLLRENANRDELWDVHNHALGDEDGITSINIAGNLYSSSLLDMLPNHIKSSPNSKYVGTEDIRIQRLDSIFTSVVKHAKNVYMKIDTQGYEEHVLNGAKSSLQYIDTLQLEMSLIPLYTSELLFNEMYQNLFEKGYKLIAVEPGFTDNQTGQLLQFDGIFHRM